MTTHDPKRINFSENTSIHECLLICRRHGTEESAQPTEFVSLRRMPEGVRKKRLLPWTPSYQVRWDTGAVSISGLRIAYVMVTGLRCSGSMVHLPMLPANWRRTHVWNLLARDLKSVRPDNESRTHTKFATEMHPTGYQDSILPAVV